jgi:hypothetical protein
VDLTKLEEVLVITGSSLPLPEEKEKKGRKAPAKAEKKR